MTPKAPDYGHSEADKKLIALARRLHKSYRQARISLSEKIEDYLEEFEKQDAEKRALYDSGELSHEDFIKWREQMITDTRAWRDMSEQLANDMTKQNEIAASIINDTLPDVYAINHNYGTFEAEKGSGIDTTYTMYDKFTVKRLLTEDEDLLPHPSVPVKKDKLWNRQRINSAVLQGILTGEPMKDIAKRLESVSDMTERSAMRNARTAVTGAENAGRIDSYKRAVSMGIKMKQVWMATLDGRTRDSHAMMDGEKVEVGKKFSNGCRYPGDPEGAPAEIYNCRCTLVAEVEGSDAYDASTRTSAYLQEQGLTYEQWQERHLKPRQDKSIFGYEYGQDIKYTNIRDNNSVERHRYVVTKEKDFKFPDGTANGVFAKRDADVFIMDDGVRFVFPSDMDKSKQSLVPDDLIKQWYVIPENYRKKIQKEIVVCDYKNPMDSYFEKLYNMPDFRSYMVGGKNITVWEYSEPHYMDYFLETLVHEGGHYIDKYVAKNISESPDWIRAVASDLAETGFDAPTGYAKKVAKETGKYDEDFAESCLKYILDNDRFSLRFPNRAKIIEGILSRS